MPVFPFDDDEPSRQNGYALSPLDRMSERRDDAAFVTGLLGRDDALFVLMAGERPLVLPGTPPRALHDRSTADRLGGRIDAAVFLGVDGPAPRFAIPVEDEQVDFAPLEPGDLRALAIEGIVGPGELSVLAAAKSLVDWHARHGFCARCGSPTTPAAGGWRRECARCGAQHFPRTDPVVIMLATDGERCVLGRQARFAPGMYSCLAGFVEPGETIEDAVRREVREESGLPVGRVRYVASQPWPFPSSLMIGCLAEASGDIVMDTVELEDCRWFSRADVRAIFAGTHPEGIRPPPPMAIAHRLMRLWAED